MSNTLIATLGGLCALLLWGVGDYLVAKAGKGKEATEVNAAFQLPGLPVILAIILLTHQHINHWHDIWVISTAGLIFTAAFIGFIKALGSGAIGIVVPVASTFPLFTIILTAIFLTLNFSAWQVLAMIVVVAGVVALAYEKRDKKIPLRIQHNATMLAILTAALWGAGNVVQNSVISNETWPIVLGTINISMMIFGMVTLLLKPEDGLARKLSRVVANKKALLAGGIYTFGSFGFYYSSVKVGSVLIPVVVASASPLITSGLGAIFDKEKLGLLKRVGAVVVVAGIILLNTA